MCCDKKLPVTFLSHVMYAKISDPILGEENILYLGCDAGYMAVTICQFVKMYWNM